MKTIFLAAVTAIALPALATAHEGGDATEHGLEVHDAYARSSNPKAGAAFMAIYNHGEESCTLTAAATDAAGSAELHTNETTPDGVVRMKPIEGGIELAAGSEHMLERGGDHLMLMGLTEPLENGDEISITLNFGACGDATVTVPVDNDRMPKDVKADHDASADAHGGHTPE
ncbi:copper chaperone PCu(A)C [Paracoccus sp. SCSIO 75233]|uniref:copper chaperone PCu(A)C n=1 Tax=Paracoccus sp. SCSIO 75233 TaxID=3017782 RepID=UPI0022F06FF1|nr:copper chaperone PCu(A)C [Paracoccus sp. SCSIO 75233]WBU53484.1 copper chaperone PCu(A)C [Paracoccus sp. SCSIO 75233]